MPNPYDEFLYAGHPFAQTHPDRLATIGRLFGMSPAPAENCRVFELGCGDGGNLIPMAYTLPESRFSGIDLGERGIAKGREMIGAIGARNIDLYVRNILDEVDELGEFDYVIAHGVYSWVPPQVQERMLAICSERLSAQGIAFISYSAYPGAHVRAIMADLMQFHARRFADPVQKVEQVQALLSFLAESRPQNDLTGVLLRHEMQNIVQRRAQSVYHDELGECRPCYFREFVQRAALHDLQYLGEADFFEMHDTCETPEVQALLRRIAPDPIEKEQYLDFLKLRRFRQTLLCRAQVPLQRGVDSSRMRDFRVQRGKPSAANKLPTEHPTALAVLDEVSNAWPASLTFDELARDGRDPELVADIALAFSAAGIFQLQGRQPRFARTASELPRASAVAQFQASRDEYVTNLCHQPIHLQDEVSRKLLALLDGTRTRSALAETLSVPRDELDAAIAQFAKLALLES